MMQAERRGETRQRTRLRPGKLYSRDGRFLADAVIVDMAAAGICLRVLGPLPAEAELVVLDEREATAWLATRIWTQGPLVGLAFETSGRSVDRPSMARLAGRYYAAA